MATTKKTTTANDEKYDGFSEEERAAMKERAKELKKRSKADPEIDVLAKIAEMSDTDRAIGERLHALIKENAPVLTSRLWYGMPAYARDGKIVCHFVCAGKFNTRYATFAFSDEANLDDGTMWPNSFALTKLTADVEKRIAALVRQAAS